MSHLLRGLYRFRNEPIGLLDLRYIHNLPNALLHYFADEGGLHRYKSQFHHAEAVPFGSVRRDSLTRPLGNKCFFWRLGLARSLGQPSLFRGVLARFFIRLKFRRPCSQLRVGRDETYVLVCFTRTGIDIPRMAKTMDDRQTGKLLVRPSD